MLPLIGRVFSKGGANDLETGHKRTVSQASASDAAVYPFTYNSGYRNDTGRVGPPLEHNPSSRSSIVQFSAAYNPSNHASPTSSSFIQVAQPVVLPPPTSSLNQPVAAEFTDRLTIPSFGKAASRSRSNSKNSKNPSRRNTPIPSQELVAGEDSQGFLVSAQRDKVRVVGIQDPALSETIASQASLIEQLRGQLSASEQRAMSLEVQSNLSSERAKKAETNLAQVERNLSHAQSKAAEMGREVEMAKKLLADAEASIEVEKVWADERVKLAENNAQQELAHRLRGLKPQGIANQNREPPRPQVGRTSSPMQMQSSPNFGRVTESDDEMNLAGQKSVPVRNEKGKAREVSQPSSPSRQMEAQKQQIPKPATFARPRAGGKRLRLAPPPPPRLASDYLGDEPEAGPSALHQADCSITDLAIHDKLEAILDSNRKMAQLFERLCEEGRPQSTYRPRRKADPDFKMAAVRLPRNPHRTATLKFVRCHLFERLDIARAEDILNHKDYIYAPDTPLQRAMAAYEEKQTETGPSLSPIMRVNWSKFDGKWNSALCSAFLDYLVEEKGYSDGQPSDEERQVVVNIFWEQLTRLREIVKANRPKEQETEEQTRDRIAARRKAELAKASANSRRKNANTCLLHMESEGIDDDEKQGWSNRFSAIQELGVEGMSSDDPDDDDPLIFHIKTLPWRAQELTKICGQTDLARNTTNAYGNRRAGNLPRTRKRRKTNKASSRKAPAGKPINFYDSEWYKQLGRDRQKALAAKAAMVILDADLAY